MSFVERSMEFSGEVLMDNRVSQESEPVLSPQRMRSACVVAQCRWKTLTHLLTENDQDDIQSSVQTVMTRAEA